MTALIVGLTVAVALLGVLVAGLLRSNAEVIRALHQMGVNLGPDTPGSLPHTGDAQRPPDPGAARRGRRDRSGRHHARRGCGQPGGERGSP